MDGTSAIIFAGAGVSAIDQFLKHQQRLLDNGEIPLDQKITQNERNFVKSLSRNNSRENAQIKTPPINHEEIYEERDSEEIVNDISILTRPALTRQSNIKSSLLSTIFKNIEKKNTYASFR